MKFRTLKADEIELRIGNTISTSKFQGYTLLLYKNARADMAILDEVVGCENWQRKHYSVKDNMYCSVGILTENGWVWKDDCGTESNTEKEKGEASDSFKRACVNWGIGRELYTGPFICIACNLENEKVPKSENYRKFKVTEIKYDNKDFISELIIKDKSNKVVFSTNKNSFNSKPEPVELDTKLLEKASKLGITPDKAAIVLKMSENELTNEHLNYLITKTEEKHKRLEEKESK